MNWRHYLILFVIGLLVPFAVSRFQSLPGYMDADYYFAGGVELAKGNGFNQPFLWNYLDDPQGLPHPSHTYWMPLASIVSAIGMWIMGQTTYATGRLPFILLSACVPLLTATLAFDITRQTRLAMVSGLLSIFSFFYAPFMPVPDNYAIFMLLGGFFLLLVPRNQKWIPLALGILAGFMTLARSDGLLWLGLAGLVVMWKSPLSIRDWGNVKELARTIIFPGLLVLLGYFLVMGGWHYRNLQLFDSFMTPGGGRLLWLQTYNETFSYPAEALTREGFLNAGWDAALEDRINALGDNFSNAWIAQGLFFLFPFLLVGGWQLRNELRLKLAFTGWLILFIVMTVVFPFAGSRGSFFHAGAAFQPLWWVAIPIGFEAFLKVLQKRGMFKDKFAPFVFHGILIFTAVVATTFLVYSRVVASGWANEDGVYASVEEMFIEKGIDPQVGVIVRNPPGYNISSGRPAFMLPYGDETVILEVAERYGAGVLVLESGGTFESIHDLYKNPRDTDIFDYLGEVDDAKLYRIKVDN